MFTIPTKSPQVAKAIPIVLGVVLAGIAHQYPALGFTLQTLLTWLGGIGIGTGALTIRAKGAES